MLQSCHDGHYDVLIALVLPVEWLQGEYWERWVDQAILLSFLCVTFPGDVGRERPSPHFLSLCWLHKIPWALTSQRFLLSVHLSRSSVSTYCASVLPCKALLLGWAGPATIPATLYSLQLVSDESSELQKLSLYQTLFARTVGISSWTTRKRNRFSKTAF